MSDGPCRRYLRTRLTIVEEGFWRAVGAAVVAGIGFLWVQAAGWEKPTYDVYDYSPTSYDYYSYSPSHASSIDYTSPAFGHGDYYPADTAMDRNR